MSLNGTADGHESCGAITRQGGEPCKMRAGWGTNHVGIGRCKLHAGSTPDHVKAANRTKTEALVRTYGGPVDAPADEVLSDLIATAYGHVTWLAAQIASSASFGDVDRFIIERYDAERILAARMTKDALGVGIAERQVRLAEDQGRRISTLMRDILADVFAALAQAAADESLTVDVLVRIQREAVPAVVRRRLSEVMDVGAGA